MGFIFNLDFTDSCRHVHALHERYFQEMWRLNRDGLCHRTLDITWDQEQLLGEGAPSDAKPKEE